MAMGPKDKKTTFQHEIVCLDDLVPASDRYRRLDELVDWSFIRAAAEPYYADRAALVDPIVLVKLMLVGPWRALARCARCCGWRRFGSTCVAPGLRPGERLRCTPPSP